MIDSSECWWHDWCRDKLLAKPPLILSQCCHLLRRRQRQSRHHDHLRMGKAVRLHLGLGLHRRDYCGPYLLRMRLPGWNGARPGVGAYYSCVLDLDCGALEGPIYYYHIYRAFCRVILRGRGRRLDRDGAGTPETERERVILGDGIELRDLN